MEEVTVYALRFEAGQIYVGISKDLERRLIEHDRRQSPSTKRLSGAFAVIYTTRFASYKEARSHEILLKSGAGRRFLLEHGPLNEAGGKDGATSVQTGPSSKIEN
jgi:predicted GIY-YIG superfamily endonuclease